MATSLPSIPLPQNKWIDLYAESGITIGVQLIIQNTGDNIVLLNESATEPTSGYGFNNIEPSEFLTSAATPVGAWAMSSRGSRLQVEEA